MIAITGTPGTGKTTISWYLSLFFKNVFEINKIALSCNFIVDFDEDRRSYVVDIEELSEYVSKNLPNDSILVGHLAHLVANPEIIIVLRTHPKELENRLRLKGWPMNKIKENVEAEALGVITGEALEVSDEVFEIDTTNKHPRNSFMEVLRVIKERPNEYKAPRYDWTEAILEWY